MPDTLSRRLPDAFEWNDQQGCLISLRQVDYPADMPMLHRWMHSEHVIEQWQLNWPMPQLSAHFEKMLADDHQRLYLVGIDGQWVGYAEIYEGARDRLGRYYDAHPDDLGWHLLLGELSAFGKGYLRAIVRALSHFLFAHSPAVKIVGEPDHTVKPYAVVAQQLCYEPQGLLPMPEKTAMLYYCWRERFLQTHPAETAEQATGA